MHRCRKLTLFLRQGALAPGKTRSEMIQSVALSAVNRRWTREQFQSVMLRRSNKGAAKVFEIFDRKGAEAARAYLDLSWRKAIAFAQRNPPVSNPDEVRQQVRLMRELVGRVQWSGRTGSIDLAVLTAHLNIVERLGSLVYGASVRRIALQAGVGRGTVSKAHKRLARFLTRLRRERTQTSRWKLQVGVSQDSNYPMGGREGVTVTSSAQTPDHDVSHQRGLGKGCWRTWCALEDRVGTTRSDLAGKLSANPRTTMERLKRLERCGLARCSGSNWYRVERDFEEVAAELGTMGRLAARERLYRAERQAYEKLRQYLERTGRGAKVTPIAEATGKRMEPPKRDQAIPRREPDRLEAARLYARLGIRVLPVHGIRNGRCTCGKSCGNDAGKHPIGVLVRRGVKDATTNDDLIRRWWARWPYANVGIATGRMASPLDGLYLWAVDVDPRNGGNDTFVSLLAAAGGSPKTAVSQTGGGGTHWLFVSNRPFNSRGILGKGIDIKGQDGYIVAPPSVHLSGQRYWWISPFKNLSEMPGGLQEKLKRAEVPTVARVRTGSRRSD